MASKLGWSPELVVSGFRSRAEFQGDYMRLYSDFVAALIESIREDASRWHGEVSMSTLRLYPKPVYRSQRLRLYAFLRPGDERTVRWGLRHMLSQPDEAFRVETVQRCRGSVQRGLTEMVGAVLPSVALLGSSDGPFLVPSVVLPEGC